MAPSLRCSLLISLTILAGKGGAITIGGANIVKANVAASNGLIHVIDAVLIPK